MSIATVLSKLAAGARLSAAEAATLAEARAAATEQKMLQAMYRGYAGEPEAAAASQFFLTPQPKVADFYAAKRSQQTGRPGHVDRVLVDPEDAGEAYGHSTISLPELGFKDPMYTTARRKVSPEQIKTRERLYAQGGPVSRPMEHKRSEGQDASTQPLTGSALKALVRGWMAGTAGLPGDLEGLARAGLHMGAAPDSWFAKNVSRDPALPTSEFYKEWLPGKQQGDEVLNTIGSITGGVGATLPVKAAKGALSRVAAAAPGPMAGSRAAMRGVIKAPGGNWLSGSVEDALRGEPGFADGGSVRALANAAIGSSNLAKQVGSSADAVRSIAAGDASMSDLNSLRQMASELGYTAPGLSQALGLAATAKAGYNMATDPTGTNAAKFAAKVNPIAAQALSLYKMATDAEPVDAANFIVGFHPLLQAYNGLADSFGFANIGQLAANLTKIGNPEAPAQLRDTFSNNANSDALTRTVNDIAQSTGADSMDTLMGVTGAFGTEPGYTGYYSGVDGGGGDTSSASSSGSFGGSFPSYSGGDGIDGRGGSPGGMAGGIGG